MNRHAALLAPCFLVAIWGAGWGAGCGSPEPPIAGTLPLPTSRADDGPSALRIQIAKMYEGYRAEAFAGTGEIEVEALGVAGPGEPYVLVDCREDRERAVSMIEGAISKEEFEAEAERYRDETVVTYCTIGYRSGVYAKTLTKRGFSAQNLVGGVLAWAHDGRHFIDEDGNHVQRIHVYGAEWDLLPEGYESVYEGKSPP